MCMNTSICWQGDARIFFNLTAKYPDISYIFSTKITFYHANSLYSLAIFSNRIILGHDTAEYPHIPVSRWPNIWVLYSCTFLCEVTAYNLLHCVDYNVICFTILKNIIFMASSFRPFGISNMPLRVYTWQMPSARVIKCILLWWSWDWRLKYGLKVDYPDSSMFSNINLKKLACNIS